VPLSISSSLSLLLVLLLSGLSAVALGEDIVAPALVVKGRGTRILEVDGRPMDVAQKELAPGLHSIRFESTATVEPVPGRRSRVIREVCEAGAVYVLLQEVVASRGVRSWHHQLSSFIHDEERDRATGECVCRTAPFS
jgi:hypothetical protein